MKTTTSALTALITLALLSASQTQGAAIRPEARHSSSCITTGCGKQQACEALSSGGLGNLIT